MRGRLGPGIASTTLLELVDATSEERTNAGPVAFRGGQLGNQPNDSNRLLSTVVGLPTTFTVQSRIWRGRLSSVGSGGQFDHTGTGRLSRWPVGVDLSLIPTAGRYPARYEFSVLVMRSPVPDGGQRFGLTYNVGPNSVTIMSNATNAEIGMSIESEAAVNAGRWTVYHRQAAGGLLVSFDTGIAPLAGVPHLLGLRYEHQLVPTMSALIDGAPIFTLTGLGQVPDASTPTGSSNQKISIGQQNIINLAGQTDMWSEPRLLISRLAGYPA
jgi:hypothetical protein